MILNLILGSFFFDHSWLPTSYHLSWKSTRITCRTSVSRVLSAQYSLLWQKWVWLWFWCSLGLSILREVSWEYSHIKINRSILLSSQRMWSGSVLTPCPFRRVYFFITKSRGFGCGFRLGISSLDLVLKSLIFLIQNLSFLFIGLLYLLNQLPFFINFILQLLIEFHHLLLFNFKLLFFHLQVFF